MGRPCVYPDPAPYLSSSFCCSSSQGQATVGSLKATRLFIYLYFFKEQIQPPGPPRSRLCLAEWVCPETWPPVPVLKRPARWNDNLKPCLISFCWGWGECCHRAWTSAVESFQGTRLTFLSNSYFSFLLHYSCPHYSRPLSFLPCYI